MYLLPLACCSFKNEAYDYTQFTDLMFIHHRDGNNVEGQEVRFQHITPEQQFYKIELQHDATMKINS